MYSDENGQPASRINAVRRTERDIDYLIGMVDGVLLDGIVNQQEAERLLQWMTGNRSVANEWPANVLYERLHRMLADGVLDSEEQGELLDVLLQITGGPAVAGVQENSTTLPIDEPQPDIEFIGHSFCITGSLAFGSRKDAHSVIIQKGGQISKTITKSLDYLIIGEGVSRDWLHTSHGRKIIKAVEYRDKGVPINLVAERHWATYI